MALLTLGSLVCPVGLMSGNWPAVLLSLPLAFLLHVQAIRTGIVS
jgi:hypothetical protein